MIKGSEQCYRTYSEYVNAVGKPASDEDRERFLYRYMDHVQTDGPEEWFDTVMQDIPTGNPELLAEIRRLTTGACEEGQEVERIKQ